MNQPESFETIVKACMKTSDFLPAWQKFANTMFFVAVLPNNPVAASGGFDFIVDDSEKTKGPAVVIAESIEHLENPATNKAIRINGTRLITMLPVDIGVLVAMSDGMFGIPADLVGWLRANIEPG
jgi:hypothetical protein